MCPFEKNMNYQPLLGPDNCLHLRAPIQLNACAIAYCVPSQMYLQHITAHAP